MRIAIANRSRRMVGGAETVIAGSLSHFARAGHELGLWHELDGPRDRAVLPLPEGALAWCAESMGADAAVAALQGWRPDVLLVHGLGDPLLERRLLALAPGVFFAHNYYGTCISGTKTFTLPRPRPCAERFGWPCLLRYYPRRTGGLNPATMARQFRVQSQRLAVLRGYRFLAVLSEHMRTEYLRHGFPGPRVVRVPPPPPQHRADASAVTRAAPAGDVTAHAVVFAGRMDPLKGGTQLLRATAHAAERLDAVIELTMAGDGPSRQAWQGLAARVARAEPRVRARFPGWVARAQLPALLERADLLVVPSVWPEPFGLIGHEAGAFGLPTVAFAVGGIPEWLADGVNGHLAPGDPPTAAGLGDAIVRALQDPAHYHRLRDGAREAAHGIERGAHARAVLALLDRAAGAADGAVAPA